MACSVTREKNETYETYSDEEAQRRAEDAIRRSFAMPYKPQKELVGKSKQRPASKGRVRKGKSRA
jgi:hypothetical protein